MIAGWRTALRIARRSVRRHLGRSLLVIALISLPVAAATVADGIARTQAMGTAVTWPIILFTGLGLVGIVSGVGAAVGAGDHTREYGIVAANGGAAKHLRRIVLAQGLVLGVLGAATGLVVGAVVTVLGAPLWQKVTDRQLENLRFGWGELVIVAAGGVLIGVVAAIVPANAVARMSPADALTSRFDDTRPRTTRGAMLPLPARLAVRDAAQHRNRTVAASAAIMVTVAASIMVTSQAHYVWVLPELFPAALVAFSVTHGRADLATLATLGAPPRLRRTLAGAHALVVTVLGTVAGLVIGVASVSVQWQHLLVITLVLVLLVPAIAALATPSRLPMAVRS